MIELTAADGHTFSAYHAAPAEPPKGAVVVLQEVFGVNAEIRAAADRFAAQGYVAIAPSLFDRVEKGVELNDGPDGLSGGVAIAKQIADTAALADVQAAIDSLQDSGKVAVVGYCWGAYLSYLARNRLRGLACSIGYYGGGITDQLREKRRIPTLLHFGEHDPLVPFDEVTIFRAGRPDVTVYSYPAGHGFAFAGHAGYDQPAARRADERTLLVMSQYLVGQPPVQLTNAGAYLSQETKKKKKPAAPGGDGPPE